jgi:hypothetical protein
MKNEDTTMSSNKKTRCSYISKIGARCHADPEPGKSYCFFHDPEAKKKQTEARRQGGVARSPETEPRETEITKAALPPDLPAIPLPKVSGAPELMLQIINRLRRGEMDTIAAKTIGYLTSLMLRALKENVSQAADALAETINQFRSGEMDLSTAKAIGYLASILLRSLKEAALQEQQDTGVATRSGMEAVFVPTPLSSLDREIISATKPGRATPNTISPEFATSAPALAKCL